MLRKVHIRSSIVWGALVAAVASFFWFKGKITWFNDYVQVPDLNYYLTPVIVSTLALRLPDYIHSYITSVIVCTLAL